MPSSKKKKGASKKGGCKCRECKCVCGYPMAVYADLNGKSTFTGIVKLSDDPMDLLKLDDPRGPLEGPGHRMVHIEFCSDLYMYDGYEDRRVQVPIPHECMEHRPADFAANAMEESTDDDPVHEAFPFERRSDGSLKVRVRAGDRVKIAVYQRFECCDKPCRERFWVFVTAVTAGGVIVGFSMHTLNWFNIVENELLFFDGSAVIAVKRGEHWRATATTR